MLNNSIFANANAFAGAILHLDDLIKKAVENGNILEAIKAQKFSLRNVLQVKRNDTFLGTIASHGHLFFWELVLDYYNVRKNLEFDPAQFCAKYKVLLAEHRRQSRVLFRQVQGSGAAPSEVKNTGNMGAVPTGTGQDNGLRSTGEDRLRED
ncbi:hypothetical protein CVT25_011917 [Psilocybe cyanescens]|uniref:Uncharacterized protein n=1 Tax=Psilocybe cyanescens TaxID=93625 RepID=A0A409XQS5_PSICY|nr:hypothetical protein CVT25_011917 [Psilocybe cyanescens]